MYRPDLAEQYASERQQLLLAEAARKRQQRELRQTQTQPRPAAEPPRSIARWFFTLLRNRTA